MLATLAAFFSTIYLTSQKMKPQLIPRIAGSRIAKAGVTVIVAAVLSACANYAGISSDKQMAQPQSLRDATKHSAGQWSLARRRLGRPVRRRATEGLACRSAERQSVGRAGPRPRRSGRRVQRHGEGEHHAASRRDLFVDAPAVFRHGARAAAVRRFVAIGEQGLAVRFLRSRSVGQESRSAEGLAVAIAGDPGGRGSRQAVPHVGHRARLQPACAALCVA